MILIERKYRKKYAALMLFSYLFLVTLSILHYHHVDIQEGNYYFISNTQNGGSGPFDKLIDGTHECTIQQFASTVLDYDYIFTPLQINNAGEEEFKVNKIIFHQVKPYYQSKRLRAPPSIL